PLLSFFFTATPPTRTFPLSLHDALPICLKGAAGNHVPADQLVGQPDRVEQDPDGAGGVEVVIHRPLKRPGQLIEGLRRFRRRRRSEEHTSELQSREKLVCRLLLEKKKKR